MNAHVISNVTITPLLKYLSPWQVTLGEYDSLIPELIDDTSTAASVHVTHVVCCFDSDALLGDAFYGFAAAERALLYIAALDRFCAAHPDKTVISNTFCFSTARVANFADIIAEHSVRAHEASLNTALIELARKHPNLLVFDLEQIVRRYGEDQLMSAAFWYSGRIRYTNLMYRCLGSAIVNALRAYQQNARKVLVVDLDNTLWGGIVGELGASGIELSQDGKGSIFRDFQRELRALKDTGVLLAICSKNNPADVDEVFEKNSLMILKQRDFACIRVNWEPKYTNINDIAATLNLGLESFVFIDDSPVERDIVRSALPQVTVPEFPTRLETLPRWFVDDVVRPYFGRYRLTNEDRQRTQQYHANGDRRSLAARFDLDTFIAELDIVCTTHVNDPELVTRASQMTQKTNQFNATTMRYDVPGIMHYVRSPAHALILLEYADRFGSEGNVGLVMLDLQARQITNFLMSCRVIGRRVEERLAEAAFAVAREHGLTSLRAEFIPTAKNAQVAGLYDTLGFDLIAQLPDGRKLYEKDII